MTRQFKLKDEYIELVKLLKLLRIAETGGHAKILVENGEITRNGEVEYRKRAKLIAGDIIEIFDDTIEIIN